MRWHRQPAKAPTAALTDTVTGRPGRCNRPRVLHVVETWRPVSSGYAGRSWQIVSAQAAAGAARPFVLVSSRQALFQPNRADVPPGLSSHDLHVAMSPPIERALRRIRPYQTSIVAMAREIESACRAWQIDIIHCHWSSGIGAAARRAAQKTGLGLIGEVRFDLAGATMSETVAWRIPGLESALRRHFERYLRSADAVVAASHSLAALIAKKRPGIQAPINVMPNAVDCQRYRPGLDVAPLRDEFGLDAHAFIIGSTTNMLRYEGLDWLLDAVERLASELPALHVVLVGDGTQFSALAARVTERSLPVTLTGRVAPEAVPFYLNLLDLFVVPRRDTAVTRYASPIKLIEAMACGIPSVASALGDIPDILASGGGRAIAPDDPEALADAIRAFAIDDTLRATSARRAREWALAQPDWPALAERYGALYDRVLQNKSTR